MKLVYSIISDLSIVSTNTTTITTTTTRAGAVPTSIVASVTGATVRTIPNGTANNASIKNEKDVQPLTTVISMATNFGQDEILNELFNDDKDDASNASDDESKVIFRFNFIATKSTNVRLKKTQNFQKTNESKTICALREFLAKGNGGRMLRVLESLDLKVNTNLVF